MTDAPGLLDRDATLAALQAELDRTSELAGRVPPDQPIPTCPAWDAAELLEHLGGVHRWATAILEQRATEPVSRRTVDMAPPSDGSWATWIERGTYRLMEVLRSTPGDEVVWAWGPDHHARWWARRQLHEAMVHNADLLLALGERCEIDPLVAADGICELFDNTPARLAWPDAEAPSMEATVHLHATDADPDRNEPLLGDRGEWMVTMAEGQVTYTQGHGKGDTAVRGPVTELLLVVNRRSDPGTAEVEVFGSDEALQALLSAAGH